PGPRELRRRRRVDVDGDCHHIRTAAGMHRAEVPARPAHILYFRGPRLRNGADEAANPARESMVDEAVQQLIARAPPIGGSEIGREAGVRHFGDRALHGGLVYTIAERAKSRRGFAKHARRRTVLAIGAGDNQIGRAGTVAAIDLEAAGEHRKIPFQDIDEDALARREHRPERDMFARPGRLVDDEHHACHPNGAARGQIKSPRRPATKARGISGPPRVGAALHVGMATLGKPGGVLKPAGPALLPSGPVAGLLNQAANRQWRSPLVGRRFERLRLSGAPDISTIFAELLSI
ncbi:MAG TPA: hypothetical protein VN152_09725, partial [Sphingopyxis sp.]|nr:hypothetical protein [Sphingopyxis sp.]